MLAGGKNQSFGLVLPSLEHGISLQIANGANAEAQKHGYGLLIANADNDDILSARYLSYFMGTQMAGILVQPMSVYGWKPSMATPSVPTVYLDFHSDEPGVFCWRRQPCTGAPCGPTRHRSRRPSRCGLW